MKFKLFLLEQEIEDDEDSIAQELLDKLDNGEIEDIYFDTEEYGDSDEDDDDTKNSIHIHDLDIVTSDHDDADEDEDINENSIYFDYGYSIINEAKVSPNRFKARNILQNRWKKRSRSALVKKISKTKNNKVSAQAVARFKMMYQWNPKKGQIGGYIVRKNKTDYMKKHPYSKEIQKIKKKVRLFNRVKRSKKSMIRNKTKRTEKRINKILGGRNVNNKGQIVRIQKKH